jgi:hypothetical protein
MTSIATPFAALFFGLTAIMGGAHTAAGLVVRIAGIGRCGDVRDIILEVLPGGGLRLNNQNQKREELGRRLEDIFTTRALRYVFVTSDPNVPFGEVVEVIDIAAKRVDYVAIVTPSVMKQATYLKDGTCLDPNLPRDYIAHPPRQ